MKNWHPNRFDRSCGDVLSMIGKHEILVGDCREVLATLPERHYHCCVTSPPYFGLRDYKVDGQIGLESTPDEFVATMVGVFRGVWRVLRDDGTLWVNLGDTYFGGGRGGNPAESEYRKQATNEGSLIEPPNWSRMSCGLKPKDLMGMPWRVAFALQADGWYLRDAIVWHKPAPMPGSQRDRCTTAYELIFQLTKKPRYFFDMEAIKEGASCAGQKAGYAGYSARAAAMGRTASGNEKNGVTAFTSNARIPRNVWKIASEGFSDAHFATFPRELPLRCIKAGTSEKGCCSECGAPWVRVVESERKPTRPGNNWKGAHPESHMNEMTSGYLNVDPKRHVAEVRTVGWQPGCKCDADTVPCRVLDPFGGAGTTAIAACLLGRDATLIELSPKYADMAERRIGRETKPGTYVDESKAVDAPLFGVSHGAWRNTKRNRGSNAGAQAIVEGSNTVRLYRSNTMSNWHPNRFYRIRRSRIWIDRIICGSIVSAACWSLTCLPLYPSEDIFNPKYSQAWFWLWSGAHELPPRILAGAKG